MNEELIGLSAHELLQVFLHRDEARSIGVRGGDRHDWLLAEQEVEDDLRALAAGDRDATATGFSEEATEVHKAEVREAFLDQLEAELGELDEDQVRTRAALTRVTPLRDGRPDLGALRELVDAWAYALSYEDKDANDGDVPYQAEELIALYRRHRAGRDSEVEAADQATRGDAPIRTYSPGETFSAGEWIAHPKFGEGVVLRAHAKIVVRFRDQPRTLVHTPPAS